MAIRFLYIDLNSFFASCEQQEHPELRGRPVAVVATAAETTSVIAASYEAKKFGIKTNTKVYDARKMCPGIVFVVGNHKTYIEYHHKIITAVDTCVPIHSVCSIDEIACELKGSQLKIENAKALALKIKKAIQTQVGECLTSSIGIGPNILISKIAADMQKPNGLTVIDSTELPQKLYSLKLDDVPGIGSKMLKRINARGIHSMQHLLSLPAGEMRSLWGGIIGERYFKLLKGETVEVTRGEQKSIGHSHVLPPEKRNYTGTQTVLKKLVHKAANRLRRAEFMAREMRLSVRAIPTVQQPEERFSQEFSFQETQDTGFFLGLVDELFKGIPRNAKFIKASVTLSNFIHEAEHQLSFFSNDKKNKIYKVMDQINEKYGRPIVYPGDLNQQMSAAPTRIAFTRIPELDEV